MDKEEIAHLETMISLHKKNLYTLEEMLARYGADQPLHLINSATMEREAIEINGTGKLAQTTLFCGKGGGTKDHFAVFTAKQQNFHCGY